MKEALKQHLIVFPTLPCRQSSVKWMAQPPLKYTILIFLISLTLLTLFATSIRPTHVKIQEMEESISTHLPLKEHSDMFNGNTNDYTITGGFSSSWFSQHIVHITPNDCITSFWINGVNVNLDTIITGDTCDELKGFDIDLKNYLKDGNNQFKIELRNDSSWLGLRIQYSSYDRPYLILLQILMLEIMTLLYFFLRNHFQFPQEIVLVILLGLLLRVLYLSYTPYNLRTYDVLEYGGHLDYIKYVANNLRLPEPNLDSGWEYHQSPLYYISAAAIYRISNTLNIDYLSLLQILSLIYSALFLLFGTCILQIVCKRKLLFFTSTALLAFWPSGIIHAIRIGNDAMYSMVFVIAVYFLMQWLVYKESKHFYVAALFAALALATKISGILVLALFGIFFVSTWLKTKPKRSYLLKTLFLISVILLVAYFSLFRNLKTALQDSHFNIINGNAPYTINSGLAIGNTLHNYIYFHWHMYLTQAFTDTWSDVGGRQYFGNFLLKSMLFGEFSFPSAAGQWVAHMLSVLLLSMVTFLSIGLFISVIKLKPSNLLMIWWFILSLLSLLYFRHTYPFSPNQDFRYIFPAIIPFIYFYLTGIEFFIEYKLRIIGVIGYIIAFLFIIGSCIFFIIPLAM